MELAIAAPVLHERLGIARAGFLELMANLVFGGLDTCMSCKPEEFDAKWEELMNDYLTSGGQAIIDERTQKWEAQYGSKDMLD